MQIRLTENDGRVIYVWKCVEAYYSPKRSEIQLGFAEPIAIHIERASLKYWRRFKLKRRLK